MQQNISSVSIVGLHWGAVLEITNSGGGTYVIHLQRKRLLKLRELQLTEGQSETTHLSCCVLICAVWRDSLIVFQESSEGKFTAALLIRHPYRLALLFLVDTSRTGHPH